jgi:5-methylcytosine-specific restriction endonuclease McrA
MTDKRIEFTLATKLAALRRSGGRCEAVDATGKRCNFIFKRTPGEYEIDHVNPAAFCDGDVSVGNAAVLCCSCHATKTKQDITLIAKSNRITKKEFGLSKSGSIRTWRSR